MKRLAFWVLLWPGITTVLSGAPPADEESYVDPTADSILITAGADRHNSGVLGSSGSLEWIHPSGAGGTYTLGFGVYSTGSSRWSYLRLGAGYPLNDRITIQGQANTGGGYTEGDGFGYQVYDASLTYKVIQGVYIRLGDQFSQIADSRSHLLKPGLVVVPTRHIQVDLTYARSASGNIGAQFFSSRVDFTTRAINLLGGFSLGHSTPQSFNLEIGSVAPVQDFQDSFAGVSVRLSNTVLTVVTDFLNTEAGRRRSVTLSWKVPIGKRDRGNARQ